MKVHSTALVGHQEIRPGCSLFRENVAKRIDLDSVFGAAYRETVGVYRKCFRSPLHLVTRIHLSKNTFRTEDFLGRGGLRPAHFRVAPFGFEYTEVVGSRVRDHQVIRFGSERDGVRIAKPRVFDDRSVLEFPP